MFYLPKNSVPSRSTRGLGSKNPNGSPEASATDSPEACASDSPEACASLFSRITFGWVVPYLSVLRKPDLDFDDLIPPHPDDNPPATVELYRHHLQPGASVLLGLISAHRPELLRASVFIALVIAASVIAPLAFAHFLSSVFNANVRGAEIGIAIAIVGGSSLLHALAIHHMFFQFLRVSLRARTGLPLFIFEKLGKLSLAAYQQHPSGSIVNLVATDVNRLAWFFNFFFSLLLHPLQIVTSIGLITYLVGTPGLIGSAVLLLLLSATFFISRKEEHLNHSAMTAADRRISRLTEVLSSIKLVKLYGWEYSVARRLKDLRSKEAHFLSRAARLEACSTFLFSIGPFASTGVVVALLLGQNQQLELAQLLPVLSVFGTLRFALSNLPGAVQSLLDARVSAARIGKLLNGEERVLTVSPSDPSVVVKAESLSTTWTTHKDLVRSESAKKSSVLAAIEINLTIKRGELLGIVGAVGEGKTALLLSLAGELTRISGLLERSPRYEYVPQVPWILSDTVRGNIILDRPFDEARYEAVLSATALDQDCIHLPNADLTVIGERGVNLSGGQRQRVALARAAYGDADLLLLDDVLSALDPQVGAAIHRDLLKGLLAGRGCVLVTHRHEFLEGCSHVYQVVSGKLLPWSGVVPEYRPQWQVASADNLVSKTIIEHTSIIEKEERRSGAVQSKTALKYLRRLASPVILFLTAAMFFGRDVLRISADTALALWSQQQALDGHLALAVYLVAGFAAVVLLVIKFLVIIQHGIALSTRYHDELTSAIFSAPLKFFAAHPVGRIVNRFSRDIATLDETVPRTLNEFLNCSISVLLVTALMLYVSPLMLLCLVPVLMLYLRAQSIYRPANRECQRLDSVSRSPILAVVAETAPGIALLRDPHRFGFLSKRMEDAAGNNGRAFYNLFATNRWLGLMIESMSTILVLSAFSLFAYYGGADRSALGGIALMLLLGMSSDLNWGVRSLSMLEGALTSAERLEKYTATEPEEEKRDLVGYQEPEATWPSRGEVQFDGGTFAYRADLPVVVQDLSFSVKAGERVGIVGRSGAGKSTILLALFRAIEIRSGSVTVDGVNLSTLSRATVRLRFGYIPQEPMVLGGTIRENLDPFDEFNDSQLWYALDKAHLKPFVELQEGQLQFAVAEGGTNLSHGQRQLICLARVILKKPKLLLLDEPTSSVDPETDSRIQETLRSEFSTATIITIAHRIETLLDYDRLIVIREGRKVAEGPPPEILAVAKEEVI